MENVERTRFGKYSRNRRLWERPTIVINVTDTKTRYGTRMEWTCHGGTPRRVIIENEDPKSN